MSPDTRKGSSRFLKAIEYLAKSAKSKGEVEEGEIEGPESKGRYRSASRRIRKVTTALTGSPPDRSNT
jgi:hypothetical protein